ncbi:MAG: AAA family ATPase [Patescibacteria group bacterium]|nr:AAA family ATPase [Patescibacteria group bacterium]
MLIELYGLPGSGKTTLAKIIAKEKGYKIIKIRSKRELFFYNLIFLFKYPYKFFVQLFYLISNSNNLKIFYFKLMNTFLDYNAKYQKAKKYKNAILDQGYFLNAFALFDSAVSKEKMKKYLSCLLKPDLLVILDIPFSLSLERAKNRGYFAREDFDDDYKNKWQKAIEGNNKIFLNIIDKSMVNYVEIDGCESGNKFCQELLKKIQDRY